MAEQINCRVDHGDGTFDTIYANAWVDETMAHHLHEGSEKLIVRRCTTLLFEFSFETEVPEGATMFYFEGPLLVFSRGDKPVKALQASYN